MQVNTYVQNTHAATHRGYSLELLEVFAAQRHGEDELYKPWAAMHNRRLLWHGSRLTNWVGILSQGLRIAPPEAPVTGYMFGKGVYFAVRCVHAWSCVVGAAPHVLPLCERIQDMCSKSANYCA